MRKIKKAFSDTVKCAPVWFASGNVVIASLYAEKFALSLNALALAAILTAQVNASIRQKQFHFPFTPLILTNFITVASILYQGVSTEGLSTIFSAAGKEVLQTAFAFSSWGMAHMMLAREIKLDKRENNPFLSFRVYGGLGLLAMTTQHEGLWNLLPATLITLGIIDSFTPNKKLYKAHLLYGLSYLSSIALAYGEWQYMAAQTLWMGANMMLFWRDWDLSKNDQAKTKANPAKVVTQPA